MPPTTCWIVWCRERTADDRRPGRHTVPFRIDGPRLDRGLVEDAPCARSIRAEVFRMPIERLLTGAPAKGLAGMEDYVPSC